MRTWDDYPGHWPFDGVPPSAPSRGELQEEERESRRRAEQARRRVRAERLAAGLPECEPMRPGDPF